MALPTTPHSNQGFSAGERTVHKTPAGKPEGIYVPMFKHHAHKTDGGEEV
jgi:hypothetical protein